MFLFTLLFLILIILTVVTVTAVAIGGSVFIVIFSDVIVCIVIIGYVLVRLIKKNR